MENADAILSSDRARVELILERDASKVKFRDVRQCEASGNLHLVVVNPERQPHGIREAWSEKAVYDGVTRIITVPHEMRAVQRGGKPATFQQATFKLPPRTADRSHR